MLGLILLDFEKHCVGIAVPDLKLEELDLVDVGRQWTEEPSRWLVEILSLFHSDRLLHGAIIKYYT